MTVADPPWRQRSQVPCSLALSSRCPVQGAHPRSCRADLTPQRICQHIAVRLVDASRLDRSGRRVGARPRGLGALAIRRVLRLRAGAVGRRIFGHAIRAPDRRVAREGRRASLAARAFRLRPRASHADVAAASAERTASHRLGVPSGRDDRNRRCTVASAEASGLVERCGLDRIGRVVSAAFEHRADAVVAQRRLDGALAERLPERDGTNITLQRDVYLYSRGLEGR